MVAVVAHAHDASLSASTSFMGERQAHHYLPGHASPKVPHHTAAHGHPSSKHAVGKVTSKHAVGKAKGAGKSAKETPGQWKCTCPVFKGPGYAVDDGFSREWHQPPRPNSLPPPPAEAATNWANHAFVASKMADSAAGDVEVLREKTHDYVLQTQHDASKLMRWAALIGEQMQKDGQHLVDQIASQALHSQKVAQKMVDTATKQALMAHTLATKSLDAARKAEFAKAMQHLADEPKKASFASVAAESGTGIAKHPTAFSSADKTEKDLFDAYQKALRFTKAHETDKWRHFWGSKINKAEQLSGDLKSKSDGYVFLTRLAGERLLHDAALQASSAVASAQRLVNQTAVKSALATHLIGQLLSQASHRAAVAEHMVTRAEAEAMRAAEMARQMANNAKYSQSSAMQAAAAQMAQAMGYSVAPQGVPSPLTPLQSLTIRAHAGEGVNDSFWWKPDRQHWLYDIQTPPPVKAPPGTHGLQYQQGQYGGIPNPHADMHIRYASCTFECLMSLRPRRTCPQAWGEFLSM